MFKIVLMLGLFLNSVGCFAQGVSYDFSPSLKSLHQYDTSTQANVQDLVRTIEATINQQCKALSENDQVTVVKGGIAFDGCEDHGCEQNRLPAAYLQLRRSGGGKSYLVSVNTAWVSTDEPYLVPEAYVLAQECSSQ